MGLYLFAIFLGLGLGIFFAVARHYGGPVTSRIATAYIEFFRSTPLLVQILIVTLAPGAINLWLQAEGMAPFDINWVIILPDIFGSPSIFLNLRILLCAITLGLNSAAYQAEYFRGSMASISAGQSLAALSIGMTKRQEIRHVALPQSLRRAIPAWSNEAAYLPKYTTVCYLVSVEELFAIAKLIVARTYRVLEVYVIVAIVFLVLISFISWLLNYIYDRVKIPGI
ncbi:MAG: amino acid ABC transporter permease [Candidatus Thorarchaeota archaeon]|nr:MAG: amino acid ABC transporter permease [Candidatus Thorarchaeota archaeon]